MAYHWPGFKIKPVINILKKSLKPLKTNLSGTLNASLLKYVSWQV